MTNLTENPENPVVDTSTVVEAMTNRKNVMNIRDIPPYIKDKLLAISEQLPREKRQAFLKSAGKKIGRAVNEHPRTLVYSILGYVLGAVLDSLLTFGLPGGKTVCLTLGKAAKLLAVSGALYGFWQDRKAMELKQRIQSEIAGSIREALATS